MKKCWAQSLGNCSDQISKEHIVSDSILPEKIRVSGFKWCKDKEVEIGSSNLTSKILCKYHNNFLHRYDLEIQKLQDVFREIEEIRSKFEKRKMQLEIPILYSINLFKIERWLVKTLLNLAIVNEECDIDFERILPNLYNNKPFEKPHGFYTFLYNDDKVLGQGTPLVTVLPIFQLVNDINYLVGGELSFRGLKFLIFLPPLNRIIKKVGNRDISDRWHSLEVLNMKFSIDVMNGIIREREICRINFVWSP